jgi:hypothetical protein
MGVITLKIDDALEHQLRRRAGELHGATKGAISKSVEEAIASWLASTPAKRPAERTLTAFLDGSKVAESTDLSRLAKELREKGVDPRSVEIRMAPAPANPVHLGVRISKAPA